MPPKKNRLVYRKYDKSKRSRTDEEDIVPELDVQINRPNNRVQYSKKRRLGADKESNIQSSGSSLAISLEAPQPLLDYNPSRVDVQSLVNNQFPTISLEEGLPPEVQLELPPLMRPCHLAVATGQKSTSNGPRESTSNGPRESTSNEPIESTSGGPREST